MRIWSHKSIKFRIGMRTAKSAVAVMIAMAVVYFYGVTTSRIIFAVLGAMEAMQPTIKASLRSCLTQITGVISGAIFGLVLTSIGLHPLITTGIGMAAKVNLMASQITVFTNQKLIMQLKRQQEDIHSFEICEGKVKELLARMEILSRMGTPGCLTEENKQALLECGAVIRDTRVLTDPTERDIVVNYHIKQILRLRRELTEELHKTVTSK